MKNGVRKRYFVYNICDHAETFKEVRAVYDVELTVKVLNGCGVNDRHWVFVSSGSTVRWTVTVTDTGHLTQRTYENDLGEVAPLSADTGAFACSTP